MPPSQPDDEQRRAIFRRCTRSLAGGRALSPREVLHALAEATGEDETADGYGMGKIVSDFEAEIAALLGKEAAVFMPTGIMAQQIALRLWCER